MNSLISGVTVWRCPCPRLSLLQREPFILRLHIGNAISVFINGRTQVFGKPALVADLDHVVGVTVHGG